MITEYDLIELGWELEGHVFYHVSGNGVFTLISAIIVNPAHHAYTNKFVIYRGGECVFDGVLTKKSDLKKLMKWIQII